MKILIFNSLYSPNIVGGAEKSTQLLAEGLKTKGWQPVIVTTADHKETGEVNGIKVYYLKTPNLYWICDAKKQPAYKKPIWHIIDAYNPFIKKSLTQIIEKEKPAVIHTNNLTGISVAIWKIAQENKIPIVHTIRDHYLLCPKTTMYKNNKNCKHQCWDCKLLSMPKKKLSDKINVVGISKFILDKHLKFGYFNHANIKTYIYNPINNIKKIQLWQNQENNVFTFGYIGLLAPSKGIEYLLRHFIQMDLKKARLMIFGRGITPTYEKHLKDHYQKDNIIFMGFKRTEEIYPLLDVVVVPSLWEEPFGRIVPEAYVYGIPVIVSKRGGLPEIVDEGITGYIFNPDQENDFEEKLKLFLEDKELLNRLSKNCLEKAQEFRVDMVVEKYIDVYKQVVK